MQLQRSLFSFYKVFVKKTPLALWGLLGLFLLVIISWQMGQFITAKPVYNFDQCMMEFFNLTRTMPNDTVAQKIEQNKTEVNGTSNSTEQKSEGKKPFFLESNFYKFLNETTTIKVYLSDKVQYQQGQSNCKIILNTQKLRPNKSPQNNQNPENNQKQPVIDSSSNKQPDRKTETQQTTNQIKLLQQVTDDNKKEQQQSVKPQQSNDTKKQEVKKPAKPHFTLAPIQLPPHIRNYDQISNEEQQFLLTEHSFMHITGNQHVAYLDQTNQFEEKHNVQVHAIILTQQQVEEYPDAWFWISSRFWRFHGNELITKNANMLRSMGETFLQVSGHVKQIYVKALFNINLLISVKRLRNQTAAANSTSTEEAKDKQGNLVKEPDTEEKKEDQSTTNPQDSTKKQVNDTSKVEGNETAKAREAILAMMEELPNELIQPENIFPLSGLKLYFHYPQTLRIEDIGRLTSYVESSSRLLYKLFTALVFYGSLFIISGVIGLLVRYVFLGIITIYLFMGGCLIHNQWGWVQKYYRLIKNRFTQDNASTSFKIIVLFGMALTGTLILFTFGIKYILTNIIILTMSFSEMYYAEMLLKNYFIIEMFYFVFCRTRTTLKFFPLISIAFTILILFANQRLYCYHISWLMNMHLVLHLFLMALFIALENYVGNSEFHNEFTPSQEKPRALFYAAYDISWENTLPPVWTYFTTYFDWRYFGARERVLINKDYQMLYGRLLGMNERQELPEEEEDNDDEGRELNEHNLSENNEMNLIQ